LSLLLDLAPLRQDFRELLPIHLDPLALDQHQPVAGSQQVSHLALGQLLAVQGQAHLKVQESRQSEFGRRLVAHRH